MIETLVTANQATEELYTQSNFDQDTTRSLKAIIDNEKMIVNRGLYLAREHDKQQSRAAVMESRVEQREKAVKQKEESNLRLALLRTQAEA